MKSKENPHVVIVGAGFGGLWAAKGLGNSPVRVTVIDRNNYHLFQPLLYQVATAGLSPANIAVPIRSILRKQKNTEVLLAQVIGVNLSPQRVLLKDTEVLYDYLILALGSQYNYFNHPEWKEFAPCLKTVADARTIRKKILLAFEQAEAESDQVKKEALLTFVVIGGGPTGVELAGAIAELAHKALARDFRHIRTESSKIILFEAGPRILPSFPERLSIKAQNALEKLGVMVQINQKINQVDQDGLWASGQKIRTQNVIWAAGIKATHVTDWLSVEKDPLGRTIVSKDLSIPGHSNIFVIGDGACCKGKDGNPLPAVAPVAMQQGRFVAKVIRDRVTTAFVYDKPYEFCYRDKGNLATVGRSFAVADFGWLRMHGLTAWLLWVVVHIFYLIGFRNRLLTFIEWTWGYFTFQRGARLIQ